MKMVNNKELQLGLKQIFEGEIRTEKGMGKEIAVVREEENWQEEKMRKWQKVVKKFKAGELREKEMAVFTEEIKDGVKFDLVIEMMARKPEWQEASNEIKVLASKIKQENSLKQTDEEQIIQAREAIMEVQAADTLAKEKKETEEIEIEEGKIVEKNNFWSDLKLGWNKK